MKVYWDTEDHSYIIENENGKRMRVTSEEIEVNSASDYVIMTDAILVHKVDPLDIVSIGDKVNPDKVAREGVVMRLIGTNCCIIYYKNQWRLTNGSSLGFSVNEAVLHCKTDYALLKVVRDRLIEF